MSFDILNNGKKWKSGQKFRDKSGKVREGACDRNISDIQDSHLPLSLNDVKTFTNQDLGF